MSYYNTLSETGEDLKSSQVKAETQKHEILALFEYHSGALYTPFEVQCRMNEISPITSIRRAMSNLTDEGKLEKTSIKKKGDYGKDNYTWRLKKEGQIALNF